MGRYRPHPPDDDPNQSRKRKRIASNGETSEAATAGHGINEGKKALYHCNYCWKDLSGKIRMKCVACPDFDLCVECFTVGAEIHPHKSNHAYRVMDNLSFPLICSDWNADEEILLLEGIEMYGLGNWTVVSEHVATKSKSDCIDHYNTIYMDSTCYPLPDMSHVIGKNREELLAMAKGHCEVKEGFPMLEEIAVKEESPFSEQIKVEDQRNESPVGRPSPSFTSEIGPGAGSTKGNASIKAAKRTSNIVLSKDCNDVIKIEDRSVGGKKLRNLRDEGPSMTELCGYNHKRQEFEIEYDNDAEQLLADMEFKETDTDAEHEIKVKVLHIYLKRLEERKRRKDFVLERNLLSPNPFEKDLSPEERELCQRYRVFMRFHSKEEHEELLKSVVEEQRILKRIEDLQEARIAGCQTSADADIYIQMKREAEENIRRMKENANAGHSAKFLQRMNTIKTEPVSSPRGDVRSSTILDSSAKASSSTSTGLAISNIKDDWDVTGLFGSNLLDEDEKRLCGELRLLPTHYLNMLGTMTVEVLKGTITKNSDAHGLFNVDPRKVDKVYDMLLKKGAIAQP